MKDKNTSIRGHLIVISLLLLLIPSLGYQYLVEMKDFLLQGQARKSVV